VSLPVALHDDNNRQFSRLCVLSYNIFVKIMPLKDNYLLVIVKNVYITNKYFAILLFF